MIPRPPRSTLFPTRRSSDLLCALCLSGRITQRFAIRVPHVDGLLLDRKSTRLNSSHQIISYAVFCLKKKKVTGSKLADAYVALSAPDARRTGAVSATGSLES